MAETRHPNIIVISLDSLRPDHLGCAGYFRNTSPNMDRFASEGVRLKNFFSIAGWTLPTHTGLFTSFETLTSGMTSPKGANYLLKNGSPYLLDVLKENGYIRGALVAEFALFSFPMAVRGSFDYQEADFGKRDGMGMQPLVEKGLDWISAVRKEDPKRPFFLYAYTGDIHTRGMGPDYQTDPEYMKLWTGNPDPTVTGKTPEEREKILAQYDACIRYVDHWLGKLFDGLKAQGIDGNTLIVIMSDHGDLLWDQGGGFFGHQFLYDSVLRSVLMMRYPGRLPGGKVLDCLADHTDIAPTIAEVAGFSHPQHADGSSLLPVIMDQKSEINEGLFSARSGPEQYSVRTQEWRYIQTVHDESENNVFTQFALERSPNGEELYDLKANTMERQNVILQYPDVAKALKQQLEEWKNKCRTKDMQIGLHSFE